MSGYLQAHTAKDPRIAADVEFHRHVALQTVDIRDVVARRVRSSRGCVCVQGAVWNMGTIEHVARRLALEQPARQHHSWGHQAANNAAKYAAGLENVYVCNGEGEVTFYNFLKTLHDGRDDFRDVKAGLLQGGRIDHDALSGEMNNLDSIPSPFSLGLFPKFRYSGVIFETNRGCPFECAFCTWGGPGQTVTKFATSRVMGYHVAGVERRPLRLHRGCELGHAQTRRGHLPPYRGVQPDA